MFLHGLVGHSEQWQPASAPLRSDWRVLTPELPLLDFPLRETSLDSVVTHVMALLDDHGVERVVAVGNSLGGQIALHVALRAPHRVSGLVLSGSSGLLEKRFDLTPRRPSREWLRAKVAEVFFNPAHATDELVDRVGRVFADPAKLRRLVRMARAARRDNVGSRLRHIRCPVRLIWGADDRVTPPQVALEFERRLPDAFVEFIPRCGHVPMVEHPALFGRIVERFLVERRLDPAHHRTVPRERTAATDHGRSAH